MQVTQSYLTNFLQSSISNSSSALDKVEQELATGLAISVPSDNPTGTNQILTLSDSMSNITQYQTDNTSANSYLSYTDSQLQSVQNLVTQARTIAVASANSGLTTATQEANATQIGSIITQITNLANSQLTGNYIFSGTQTSVQPFTPGDTTYTYNGNTQALTANVGPNQQMQVSTPGSTIFSPIFSALQSLQTDITSGNISNISNVDIGMVDTANSSLNQVRANLGSSIDQLQNVTANLSTAFAELQNQKASVQDVNIATVYTQLQTDQNVYQASLEATAQTYKYSLADYITA
jgi:flagellar hook-associated protein 3 FlgL